MNIHIESHVQTFSASAMTTTVNASGATTPHPITPVAAHPAPRLAIQDPVAIAKCTALIAGRSLWRSHRRRFTIKDLLCAPNAPPAQLTQTNKASLRRQCALPECTKYSVSGGYCIGHGGGKRCQQDGCETVAQSGGLCKAHGGGSKCHAPGCATIARHRGLCRAHGGYECCKMDGCSKCAHTGGLCVRHGGGRRCALETCTKSAQSGGLCYSHGGGKRCTAPECFKAARKGGLCIRHRPKTGKPEPII